MTWYRVSIKGTTLGGEVWSVNPAFSLEGEIDWPPTQTNLDEVAAGIAALDVPAALRSRLGTGTAVAQIRVEARDDNNALRVLAERPQTGVGAGSGTVDKPQRSAYVVSLRTSIPGASNRGRIYWPVLNMPLESTGQISATVRTTILTGMRDYLWAIGGQIIAKQGLIPGGVRLAVYSGKLGRCQIVTELEGDSMLDRQQRRQDKIVPARTIISVLP